MTRTRTAGPPCSAREKNTTGIVNVPMAKNSVTDARSLWTYTDMLYTAIVHRGMTDSARVYRTPMRRSAGMSSAVPAAAYSAVNSRRAVFRLLINVLMDALVMKRRAMPTSAAGVHHLMPATCRDTPMAHDVSTIAHEPYSLGNGISLSSMELYSLVNSKIPHP